MKVLVTPRSFGKSDPGLFDRLEKAGLEVIRNNSGGILNEEAMCRLAADCEAVILGVDPMNIRVLEAAPRLKAISKYGVGTDNIDLEECKKRGIKVSRTVGANSDAVADYAFALMLAVARRIVQIDRRCHERDWGKTPCLDVHGRVLGLIGLGAIGKRMVERAKGFNMKILAADPNWDADFARQNGLEQASVDDICRNADFISLHCVLTPETRHIINAARIGQMGPETIFVNTARGELVDEDALLDALKKKAIFGAGLDVFEKEPPENPDWYKLDNVIMGSHCSSSTKGATNLMGKMAVDNLLRDLGIQK